MSLGKMNWANLIDYEIQPSDMELSQTYAKGPSLARLAGERGPGVVFGGVISIVSGFQLSISAGLAVMPDGTLVTWPTITTTLAAASSTLNRIDRIELAYALVNNTNVVDVNNVARILDLVYSVSVNVNQGTNSSTPAANSLTSGNLSLGFVYVGASATVISPSNVTQIVDSGLMLSPFTMGNQAAGVRFNTTTGLMQFSNDGSRWQAFGSGGGGGGGATWQAVAGAGAVENYEYDDRVFLFSQGQAQSMTLWVKAPKGYLAGSPVSLRLGFYSPSSSNNWQMQTVTSLVRQGLDAISSTANQYTSTNTYVTNTVAGLFSQLTFDLSSTTGQINSVGINPGDLLKVVLTRITPTSGTDDTADLRMIPSTSEVLYS